ncbi:MAG: Hsp20/alpha crystallin family protein [bacterium]|nr:Hsp20/alpha crystallin family protein [bacterium]
MARRQNDDSFLKEELEAAFNFDDSELFEEPVEEVAHEAVEVEENQEDELPGQLAIDAYETEDKFYIKARTAGVNKHDLDVSLSDRILTISGTLNAGEQEGIVKWHSQECYWGEFSRTYNIPVEIKEDGVEAMLKDGILTISFVKIKPESKKIQIL